MNKTKGPSLTKDQSITLLSRQQSRSRRLGYDYTPPRAFKVLHAYQLTANENVFTKGERQFTITGPPTYDTSELMRHCRLSKLVAVVPCEKGWRVILTPIPIDPACWV